MQKKTIAKATALPLPARTAPLTLLGVMALALSSAVVISQIVPLVSGL